MAPDVAEVLARLGQRGHTTRDDDLVFPGEIGGYLDASALRRRYVRAPSRALPYARCVSTTWDR
jgi:integrase